MDDPARSDALLASSRRMLRQEFCGERRNLKPET
jgi:hypothetical protein